MKIKVVLIAIICSVLLPFSTFANDLDDLKNQKNDAEIRIENLNSEIKQLSTEYELASQNREDYKISKEKLEKNIFLKEENIEKLDEEILSLEKDLEWYFALYNENLDMLKKQLQVNYYIANSGLASAFENSETIAQFIEKTSLIESITNEGEEIVLQINELMDKSESERTELEKKKKQLGSEKIALEQSRKELERLYTENENNLYIIETYKNNCEESLKVEKEERENLSKEISSIIKENDIKEQEMAVSSGVMKEHETLKALWPVPGFGTECITCVFGENGHAGLDIGANYATPIIACSDGKVVSADYHYSWGNNVLISHDENYKTRYAHMSKIAVNVGDEIKAGDVIGYVGSTGNSTGNHLHFEVYFNGVRVNPYLYFG